MANSHLIPTYKRQPIAFERGEGAWLFDSHGRRYLDALSGIAVNTLGHAHPALVDAIADQAGRLLHTSNLYEIEVQTRLADRLCEVAGMEAVFFGNSGSEANEAAIKLARLHGHNRGIDRPVVVVMENSFHGRTLAALAATGNVNAQKGFEPLPEGFLRVPYGDVDAIAALDDANIAAVLVEPIQGEGGVRVPPADFLPGVRRLCDERDWLMMVDEVQSGVGRTGHWFAHQAAGITPDVMGLAKGLAGGVPIGAALVAGKATPLFGPGSHGSTFGGNPLACRAALAVLETIDKQGLLAHAQAMGDSIRSQIEARVDGLDHVREIRGMGLMIGIELAEPCAHLVDTAREQGILLNVTAANVIRLLPPLIIGPAEVERLVDGVCYLIESVAAPASHSTRSNQAS
ncbi:acetylornithine transaminase [Salinisphaera sp.]|uniref:acetylornithine transaminase n=1 Tax=Salinisphaera sp. TaxID=1914330 RepID=UPI000C440E92|nr:acetylornithine transaminase [Salinisphaera sp.]MBS63910.1 aspartate aminotransferase family protein [Salinisphaera sp.]